MVEGFDVALEMSGNAAALRAAIDEHGPRRPDRDPRHPDREISLDVNAIVFNQLTLRGIYGRRDVRDLVQDAGPDPVAGSTSRPAITHRFGFRDFEAAFAAARSGDSGKVIMDWSVTA